MLSAGTRGHVPFKPPSLHSSHARNRSICNLSILEALLSIILKLLVKEARGDVLFYLGGNARMHTHMHMPWSERKIYVGMFLFI